MKDLLKEQPVLIRVTHWINVPTMAVLTWSGILLYAENDNYSFFIGSFQVFHFFPSWFYSVCNLAHHNSQGLAWHFLFMWIFAINGLIYVGYLVFSSNWRYILPGKQSLQNAVKVLFQSLHLTKELPPKGKYNAAQKMAYTSVIAMAIIEVFTGLVLYKPTSLAWLADLFGGIDTTKSIHFWITIAFIAFVIIHVGQVIRYGWHDFLPMVTGFNVTEQEDPNQTNLPDKERPFKISLSTTTEEAEALSISSTRRAFLNSLIIGTVALAVVAWLNSQSDQDGVPKILRPLITAQEQAPGEQDSK